MIFSATENSIGYALGLGALLIIAAITLWVLAGEAATGRLGPNRFVGIRTRSIMASDQTWLVAHQAAQRALQVAAIALGVTGALVAILGRNNDLLILILIVGIALMLGALAKAVIFATQTAKTRDGTT